MQENHDFKTITAEDDYVHEHGKNYKVLMDDHSLGKKLTHFFLSTAGETETQKTSD